MTILSVVDGPAEVHEAFAHDVAQVIREQNAKGEPTRLILPVGPTKGYPLLTELTNREGLSWKNVFIVTMDEYLDWTGRPVPSSHPLSFTGFMLDFLASLDEGLRPAPEQYVAPDPFDIDRVARRIDEVGGIDACFGGVGIHGHLAFNEPPISRFDNVTLEQFADSPTRVVALAPETVVMNASRALGGALHELPPLAVTIGMREILAARAVRLYCDGGVWQQEAIARAMSGVVEMQYPVTLLQNHPDAKITADGLSAQRVRLTT